MDKRIEKTIKNLEKNNMKAYYCENSAEALEKVKTLLTEGCTVSHGGTETIKQTGIIDLLKSGKYEYLDRSKCQTREETEELYRKCFNADVYITSSNAITENGELYNVDGNSNRIACIAYGPKSVVVVAGINKIVENIDKAVERIKRICAPLNTDRLDIDTYCRLKGHCVSLDESDEPFICDGCNSDTRICCNYLISARQRHKDRIKVILINEDLGY